MQSVSLLVTHLKGPKYKNIYRAEKEEEEEEEEEEEQQEEEVLNQNFNLNV